MLYVGQYLPTANASPEPALIDPSLPVDHQHPDWAGAGLHYWPSYATIPPGSRAAYQAWLADGRRYAATPIGYVFLFFYGLERRVLVDLPRDPAVCHDLPAIAAEVRRLLDRYPNRSFQSYATDFLQLLGTLTGGGRDTAPDPPTFAESRWPIPMGLRRALGAFAATGTPVPAAWARAWAWYHPGIPQRTAQTRCRDEFDRLFAVRYTERFGAGLLVKSGRRRLTLSYRPASSALPACEPSPTGVPDVLEQAAPTRALTDLVEAVTEELDAYSRWLGRHPDGRGSLAAAALLPAALIDDAAGDLAALRQWVSRRLGDASSITIDGDELIASWPTAATGTMSKAEFVAMATLLDRFGVGVEPDVRFGGPTLAAGPAVLFWDTPGAPRVADPGYAAATTLLHLAVAVSAADGSVSPDEQHHLVNHLHTTLQLSAAELQRLQAHLQWLIARGVTLTGLTRRLATLGCQQRHAIGEFLIEVATIDGIVDPGEVTTLSKIYRLLGIDPQLLYVRLHQHSTRPTATPRHRRRQHLPTPADAPVTVQLAGTAPTGFALPNTRAVPQPTTPGRDHTEQPVDAPAPGNRSGLDADAIAAKLAETAAVSALLSTIFAADEQPSPVPPGPAPPASRSQPGAGVRIPGLDTGHSRLLADLLTRSIWSRADFEELAERHGVLPAGSLDVINEAALEITGEPITEGDGDITINDYAREELRRV